MIHLTQSSLNQITDIFNRRKKAIGLENYAVGELLDHGGMSNVYRLTDSAGVTDYVLRVSEERKSSYSNDIFNVREMEILRELKKNSMPHVVQYLDAFIVDIPGQPRYYCSVMKFLCTLKQYRVQGDGVEIAVRLGCDFLPLLQSFMEQEILHRDIKPENIFYDGDFRNDTGFLLGDFGIAKRDTETSVTPMGTETTMAPEVRGLDRSLGKDRTYSDMYSLGVVMYRYLNQGVYPANRERIDKMPPDKKPFPEPRYGSKRLKALVVKATSYDPKDRFESPQAMLRELQQCEEYEKYIFDDSENENVTVDASAPVSEEIERLRRELAEREKQIEQLKNQTASKAEQKTDPEPKPVAVSHSVIQPDPATDTIPNPQQPAAVVKPAPAPIFRDSTPKQEQVKPVTTKSVRHTPPIVTVVVVLVVAIVGGMWTVSYANSSVSNANSIVKSLSELGSVSVGDHFTFGNYPQGSDGEEQPVEWRVLDVEDGKALVISEKLLDYAPYNETYTDVTWEACSLREWMNNDFLNRAFTAHEQAKIATVTNRNPDNPEYGTKGGKTTRDRIFALSIDEAKKYFSDDTDRIAYTTDYTHTKGYDYADCSDGWWLRSPGDLSLYAADVSSFGFVNRFGRDVDSDGGCVRPAFWLNL